MEAFLIYLLKSSAILSLFYLVYFFLLRKDTFFTVNRHFLLAGILSSIVFPFLEFTTIEFIEQPTFHIVEYSTTPAEITANTEKLSNPIHWDLIIFNTYILITLFLLGRFGLQLLSLRKLFIKRQHKQKQEFSFIKTSKDIAPFSFFKYIVFNPALHDTAELEMILKHEKIHAKQYHTLDLLITNLFVIFQWINPLSWFYKKSLQQNLEFIADQEAIRDLPSKKEYQLTLVKVSSNNYSTITNNFYQSLIKKRIVMLNKKQSNYQNLWKAAVILPLLSIFLWSFNTKTEIQYIPSVEEEHTNITHEHPEKTPSDDSKEITFPIKEEHAAKATEHSFPSKKESVISNKKHDITKNESTTTPLLSTKNSDKKELVKTPKKIGVKKNTVEFIINKNATKDDLDRVKRIFKNEYGVEITFSDISRNQADEITGISVAMSSKESNANYSIENETPIKPFVVSYDGKKEKISIGQSSSGYKNIWINKDKTRNTEDFQFLEIDADDDGNSIFIIEGDKKNKRKVIRKKGSKNKFIIKSDHDDRDDHIFINSTDHKTVFDFDSKSGKKPLFFIDGKKASRKDVKKLKSDEIQRIDVSKGKGSTKKYGKKAKDGVINIYTKKNAKKETGFDFRIDKNHTQIGTLDNDKRPLLFVDGKKVDYLEFKKIKQKQIASVNVYKSTKAITKFGSEGENGVVEVILKK